MFTYICTYIQMCICTYVHTYIYIHMFKHTQTYIYVHVYRCMYIYIFIGKSDYARGVADRRERDANDPRDQGARRHCRPRARQHFPVPAPSTLKSPLKPRMYVYAYLHVWYIYIYVYTYVHICINSYIYTYETEMIRGHDAIVDRELDNISRFLAPQPYTYIGISSCSLIAQ